MKFAFIPVQERGQVDRLLENVARRLIAEGANLAGVVQVNAEREGARHCDMLVQVLPNGAQFDISQKLGNESRGCRLDVAALEEAVAAVGVSLENRPDIDLLVINKFGKHEAQGRGFRDLIAQMLMRDVPVLLGVNPLNRAAFDAFSGGEATELAADEDSIYFWCNEYRLQAV
ncbi:DUF2478 domain-containing protein [Thalassospira sp. TSL5-1]|uniref:DUF2478 domain-containing protein n=1 Tax=Thalassospira sp. TSL5-1 TaxID=1544451 RepID=UPI00093A0865|nr:DUF2478 domain-containing protein [Thalassospira sp. TSL5-1]OKH86270.1 hypothetical protein LF95_23605 [Thalassospira sp. TSL5-1]